MAALPTAQQTYGIGIDFGASTACIAMCKSQGTAPEVIANEDGNRLTQASISWTEDEVLVGDEAYNQKDRNIANTVVLAKKLLGKEFEDEGVQEDVEAKLFGGVSFEATEDGLVKLVNLPVGECSIEECAKMIFQRLHRTGSMYLGENISHVCISVPSHFTRSQADQITKACEAAGMKVMRCVKEPVAAAMACGLEKSTEKNVMLFDFGGSSLDVSVVRVDSLGVFSVLGSSGTGTIGASYLDNLLFDFCMKDFKRKDRKNAMKMDDRAKLRLKEACKKAKHALSASASANIDVEALVGDVDFHANISRNMFEDIIEKDEGEDNLKDLFADIISEAMVDAFGEEGDKQAALGIKKEVDTVVFCGGGVKTTKVQGLVKEFFEEEESSPEFQFGGASSSTAGAPENLLSDELVALGCAVQADLLLNCGDSFGELKCEAMRNASKSTEASTSDDSFALSCSALSKSIGIVDAKGAFHEIIPTGAVLPVQTTVTLDSKAGEKALVTVAEASAAKLLAKVCFDAESASVEVKFSVDAEGVVSVSSGEKTVVLK